jgi:hypothetical protein
MSLGNLVQDVMRMMGGGMPGMGMGFPGGQMGQGGGMIPQGYTAQNAPALAPGFGPGTGRFQATPQEAQQALQQGGRPSAAPGQNNAPAATAGPRGAIPTQRVDASGQPTTQLPMGTREAGTQRPLIGGAAAAAPSRQPDGTIPTGRTAVTPIIASTLRGSGATNNAIQGILFNVGAESDFNPTLRHADQPNPRFRGTEAVNAHGLYQEGGDEWNNYARWLNGRDWRDPQLQTQFLAANLKRNYPQLWLAMNNARSPEDAAKLFAKDYLRPSPQNLMARYNRINRGGVQRYTVPGPTRVPSVPPADAA